jgi:hypothetical protein
MRVARVLLLTVGALLSAGPATALAGTDVTLGQVAPGSVIGAGNGTAVQLQSETGTPSYSFPPGGGYVHAWQVQDDGAAGQLRLLILAPAAGGGYNVAAQSPLQTASPGTLNSFSAPFLHGVTGDVIALTSSGPPLTFTGGLGDVVAPLGPSPVIGSSFLTLGAEPSSRLNLAATVTPAADVMVGTTLHHPPPPTPQLPPQPGSAATLPQASFQFEVADGGPNEADGVVATIGVPGVTLSGTAYGPVPAGSTATGPATACTPIAGGGLGCPVGHLDPGASVDLVISGGPVPAGSYTASATLNGTIGDAQCPLSTCDPNAANNSATDAINASGVTASIPLTPRAAPRLAALHVRPASARIDYTLSAPSDGLSARVAFAVRRSVAGVRRGGRCVRAHGVVPRARRCRRLVTVAAFHSSTQVLPTATGTTTLALSQALPRLAAGPYRLTATPAYVGVPAAYVFAPSARPFVETVAPGACVGSSGPCPKLAAVVRSGPPVTRGFSARRRARG